MFLPAAPARILDVGGATGVHAARLADAGHRVDLIDPVPSHVARAAELVEVGLGDVAVFGVEGPSAPALDNLPLGEAERFLGSAARAARLVETDPALMAASPHFLAFGRVG